MTAPPTDRAEEGSEAPVGPRLRFDVFTLFPAMVAGPLEASILKRARDRGLVEVAIHDLRAWTTDRHRTADDTPYGGGAGMVLLAAPIVAAVEETLGAERPAAHVAFLSAGGRRFTQAVARDLATRSHVALVCGHYEGIDERASEELGADQLSVGDYVLTGGEVAALVVVDAVARLVPGVIDAASVAEESHGAEAGLVEYPHYTRPAVFRGRAVPEVLLSGHHARIARWRREEAIRRTARWRPDLLAAAELDAAERAIAVDAMREDRGQRTEDREEDGVEGSVAQARRGDGPGSDLDGAFPPPVGGGR